MYAIQTGSKFLKPQTSYRSFYDVSVSDNPKFLKTLTEAKAHCGCIKAQIDTSIARFTKMIQEESATVNKEAAKIPKLKAKLEALKELPYKEVVNKVPRVERELANARNYKTSNSINSWKRDIARLERIKAGNIRVVKMQLS
jgi:hypothetical protein